MNLEVAGGATLFFSDEGTGPAVVLLHGNAQSTSAFEAQRRYLSTDYRLILIDSRGHGNSSHGSLPLTLDLLAKDVLAVLEHLGILTFSLVGFSDGANVGLKLAIEAGARLDKLILVSPNTTPSAVRLLPRLAYSAAYIGLKPLTGFSRLRKIYERLSLITREQAFNERDIAAIANPCLIIGSELDLMHRSHLRYLAEMLPNGELLWLKGIGHMRLKTSAEVINPSILNFLRKV